jgi:hypothetical protein
MNESEPAGEHLVAIVKRKLPKARIIQSKVAKDVDDSRKADGHKYEEQFVNELKAFAICPFHNFKTIVVR